MDPNRDYAIPASNPFVDAEGEDEIWAYGFRNPWRCAFDRYVGSLYIADVGHTRWEEINVQPADSPGGEYYGWRCYEANLCTAFGVCDTDSPPDLAGRACTPSLQNCGGGTCVARSCCAVPYHEPVHAYSHSGNPRRCSITGGEVYRGCAFPQLDGTYFFADFCSGQIWGLRLNGGVPELVDYTALLEPAGFLGLASISSFGMDAVGELYICDLADGEVFKIVPAVSFQSCMTGPDDVLILPALCGSSASHLCSHQFDVDANLAVDLRDFQAWQNVHGQ
jgi:hypothetical protein